MGLLTTNTYTISCVNDGEKGDAGRGVSSIIEQYYLSTSKTSREGGSWENGNEYNGWEKGKYIWTRSKITYTDGSVEYTTPICDTSWEAVNDIQIGGRNLLYNSDFVTDFPTLTSSINFFGLCRRGSVYTITRDTVETRNSKPSLKISSSTSGNSSTTDILWRFSAGSILTSNKGLIAGKALRLSFWAKSLNSSTFNARFGYDSYTDKRKVVLNTNWQKYEVQMTESASANFTNELIFSFDKGDDVYFSEVKLEYGNVSTDWTPNVNETIKSTDVMYYLSTSKTSLSGGSWTSVAPAWENNKYMWSKTVTTYIDGGTSESSPVCIAGAKGDTGSSTYLFTRYSSTASPHNDMYEIPKDDTLYMGTYSTNTNTPSTNPSDYTWVKIKGNTGDNGVSFKIEGENGTSFANDGKSVVLRAVLISGQKEVKGTYKWYKNNTLISGATSLTYTVSCSGLAYETVFKCEAVYNTITYSANITINNTMSILYGDTNPYTGTINAGSIWVDTSDKNGFVFKKYSGTKWTTITSDEYYAHVGLGTGKQVSFYSTKLKETADEISSYASQVDEYKTAYSTFNQTADEIKTTVNSADSRSAGALSIAIQSANKIAWVIKSGTSQTDFTLTERTATLVSEEINLKGLVTFSGLDKSSQNKISKGENAKNTVDTWASDAVTGTTTINGGYIKANTITTNKLATDAIKSTNYVYESGHFSTSGSFFNLTNGQFRSKNFAITSSGNAYIKANIEASSGNIGGWNIDASKIYGGDSTTGITAMQIPSESTSYVFAAGGTSHGSYSNFPFRVRKDGAIYSSKGTIGGWTITENKIYGGDPTIGEKTAVLQRPRDGEIVGVDKNLHVFAAGGSNHQDYSDCPFRVTKYGKLYSSSAEIAGWNVNENKIYGGKDGSGNTVVMQRPTPETTYVFAAGGNSHKDYNDCVFRVTKTGKLYSTSAEIAGWTMSKDKIYSGAEGSGNTVVMQRPTPERTYVFAAGGNSHESYSDCAFRVRKDGRLYAKDAVFEEKIYIWDDVNKYRVLVRGADGTFEFPSHTTFLNEVVFESETSIKVKNIIPYQRKVNTYNIGATDAYFNTIFSRTMRIGGNSYGSCEATIHTKFKDGATHNIIARGTDGLTMYFGWNGENVDTGKSYSTVTVLRGKSVLLGSSSGAAITSDERLKKDFGELDKYEAFFEKLNPLSYKYIKGTGGRSHVGFGAEAVKVALEESGLSTNDFGGYVEYDVDKMNEDYNGYDKEKALIYTEFVALNTHMIQKVMKENKELRKELEEIKNKISNLLV